MADPDGRVFEKMEWAVLLNDIGGRLFRVWERNEEYPHRVVEYYVQPGGLQCHLMMGAFAVCDISLVKIPNKEYGEKLVRKLKASYEQGERLVSNAKQTARGEHNRTVRRLLAELEAETNLEQPNV